METAQTGTPTRTKYNVKENINTQSEKMKGNAQIMKIVHLWTESNSKKKITIDAIWLKLLFG